MRIASALRPSAAGQGFSSKHHRAPREAPRRLVPLAAALIVSSALTGCGLEIAEQRYTSMKPMLVRQSPPSCEYRTTRADKSGVRQSDGQPTTTEADLDLQRAKLDYERQCYRHAEIIARNRLRDLQEAIEDTAKAVKAAEAGTPPKP